MYAINEQFSIHIPPARVQIGCLCTIKADYYFIVI